MHPLYIRRPVINQIHLTIKPPTGDRQLTLSKPPDIKMPELMPDELSPRRTGKLKDNSLIYMTGNAGNRFSLLSMTGLTLQQIHYI